MGLKLIGKIANLDAKRIYVAGMSGGGRIASQAITRYPEQFTGAICIVGADYFMPRRAAEPRVPRTASCSSPATRDFNRSEMRRVFAQLSGKAGVTHVTTLTCRTSGTSTRTARTSAQAIDFLDAR